MVGRLLPFIAAPLGALARNEHSRFREVTKIGRLVAAITPA